jgi:putative cofactor-binding repeat protein
MRILLASVSAACLIAGAASAREIVVDRGNSIQSAANSAQPGDVVVVEPGDYAGGIVTTTDGIRFVSRVPGGARIVSGGGDDAWLAKGARTVIEGFTIDGSGSPWRIGIHAGGTGSSIRGNTVRNVKLGASCNSQGGAGILTDAYWGGEDIDVTGNLVQNVGLPSCNWDQGIYIQAPGSSISGNTVDRVAGWGIASWHDGAALHIAGNTVSRAASGGISFGGGGAYHGPGIAANIVIENNRIYTRDGGIGVNPCGGRCGGGNVVRNNIIIAGDGPQTIGQPVVRVLPPGATAGEMQAFCTQAAEFVQITDPAMSSCRGWVW